jgi:ribosomal protein S18 acetylase RimI-like enzyme
VPKFILTATADSMAQQIADLLNKGGQLAAYQSAKSVLFNKIEYLIELDGQTVVGVMGLEQQGPQITEMKHLCVHPDYRRHGIGKRLLELGIKAAKTEYVYGAVREDNASNIRNNLRVGMKAIAKKHGRGCYVIIFARRKHVAARGPEKRKQG